MQRDADIRYQNDESTSPRMRGQGRRKSSWSGFSAVTFPVLPSGTSPEETCNSWPVRIRTSDGRIRRRFARFSTNFRNGDPDRNCIRHRYYRQNMPVDSSAN